MIGYFGDPIFKKPDETQIPAPTGLPCDHCGEAFVDGDMGTVEGVYAIHYECRLRQICGSIGHQKKQCSCYGGNQEDPPGMTKRQAAVVAATYWHLRGQY